MMGSTAASVSAQKATHHSTAPLAVSTYLLLIGLACAVFFSGLAVVYLKQVQRNVIIAQQYDQAKTNQLQTQWGRLLLEQGSLSMDARIENMASRHFDMVVPNATTIRMIRE